MSSANVAILWPKSARVAVSPPRHVLASGLRNMLAMAKTPRAIDWPDCHFHIARVLQRRSALRILPRQRRTHSQQHGFQLTPSDPCAPIGGIASPSGRTGAPRAVRNMKDGMMPFKPANCVEVRDLREDLPTKPTSFDGCGPRRRKAMIGLSRPLGPAPTRWVGHLLLSLYRPWR